MLFCPTCANILVISAESGHNKWACQTCPYEFPITKQMTSRTHLTRKVVEDVMDADNETGASAQVMCPKCEHPKAFYTQAQIRSADEPMTTFYR
ncbi:hypothetical protein SISSUDRAFT_991055 [Sistotremastrum suecicum HHB10207 ss-3]|nr:hypothetical protein SISSUDRAFT_991055 [Sistotremastrum suecicum HHB10207 ss-3]